MKYYNFMIDLIIKKNLPLETFAYWWLIIALCFLIMEMGSPGLFFFVSFSYGAACAAVASLFIESVITQIIIFFCATAFSLYLLQYWIVPLLHKNRPHERTNVYALQGKQGYVVKTITTNVPGLVRVDRELWAAVLSDSSGLIEQGALVEVVEVRGAHVRVKKIA